MVEARTRACINTVLMFACCNLSRMSVSSRCCEVAEWERGQSSPLMVVIQTARISCLGIWASMKRRRIVLKMFLFIKFAAKIANISQLAIHYSY